MGNQMREEPKPLAYRLFWIAFFALWMAYVESAVVVYLRALHYPDGFHFPIKFIPPETWWIEFGREAATLFMLTAVASLAGRKTVSRLATFLLGFGVWDIAYYAWLKVFLDWPDSLLTWDLLFLIPVPWVAPVLAPIIVSLSLIIGAVAVLDTDSRGFQFRFNKREWISLILAFSLIFLSFILEAPRIMGAESSVPYHWEFFILGEIIGVTVLVHSLKRARKTRTGKRPSRETMD